MRSADNFQNVMDCSLYHPRYFQKISSKFVHNFLHKVVDRQTNKQTHKTLSKTESVCRDNEIEMMTYGWLYVLLQFVKRISVKENMNFYGRRQVNHSKMYWNDLGK